MSDRESRRDFLRRWTGWAAAAAALALAACSSGPSRSEQTRQQAAALDPDLDCTDTQGLWPAEIETRTSNEYRERSQRDDQYCFNCNNYVKPERAGGCATCRTVKGPINPGGWCKTWTQKV